MGGGGVENRGGHTNLAVTKNLTIKRLRGKGRGTACSHTRQNLEDREEDTRETVTKRYKERPIFTAGLRVSELTDDRDNNKSRRGGKKNVRARDQERSSMKKAREKGGVRNSMKLLPEMTDAAPERKKNPTDVVFKGKETEGQY